MKKIRILMLPILLLLCLVCGCTDAKNVTGPASFYLYYFNNEGTTLEKQAYSLKSKTFGEQFEEIIDALGDTELAGDRNAAIPQTVEISSYLLKDDTLQLHFNSAYKDLAPSTQVLMRASLVKTFTQLPEVNAVSFFVGNQVLKDSAGNVIGALTADSFLDSFGTEEGAVESNRFTLYYPTDKGDELVKVEKKIYYSNNSSPESVVLTQLAKDPVVDGLRRAIPDGVKVLDVSVSDGICYLDLSGNFVSQTTGMTTEVSLYAIVNSLTELDGISKVQIMVNNGADNTPAVTSVNGLYEANDKLVKNP